MRQYRLLLPEQVTSSPSTEPADCIVAHSLSENSEPLQEDVIHHTGWRSEPILHLVSTAEPQSSCLHTTDDAFRFQFDVTAKSAAGFQSPWCFTSSIPVQLLVPPTNLTSGSTETIEHTVKR